MNDEERIFPLFMPDKYEQLSVKIMSKIERHGEKNYQCRVRIFGDEDNILFNMKVTISIIKSLWDAFEFWSLGGDTDQEMDDDLICIIGKIITIKGVPDPKRTFQNKDGKWETAKIFKIEIREDLDKIEQRWKKGEISLDEFNDVVLKEWEHNSCIPKNFSNVEKLKEEKSKEEKERDEKRKKREDISKNLKKLDDIDQLLTLKGGW